MSNNEILFPGSEYIVALTVYNGVLFIATNLRLYRVVDGNRLVPHSLDTGAVPGVAAALVAEATAMVVQAGSHTLPAEFTIVCTRNADNSWTLTSTTTELSDLILLNLPLATALGQVPQTVYDLVNS